jgi:preprotein translocase SecE subunit
MSRHSTAIDTILFLCYTTLIYRPQAVFNYHKNTMVSALKTYLQGAFAEMRKVSWPSQAQVKRYSLVVISLSIGMALFLGAVDYVFNLGLRAIIG